MMLQKILDEQLERARNRELIAYDCRTNTKNSDDCAALLVEEYMNDHAMLREIVHDMAYTAECRTYNNRPCKSHMDLLIDACFAGDGERCKNLITAAVQRRANHEAKDL